MAQLVVVARHRASPVDALCRRVVEDEHAAVVAARAAHLLAVLVEAALVDLEAVARLVEEEVARAQHEADATRRIDELAAVE